MDPQNSHEVLGRQLNAEPGSLKQTGCKGHPGGQLWVVLSFNKLSLETLRTLYWFTFLVTFTNLLLHLFGTRGDGMCHRAHAEVKGQSVVGSPFTV